MENNNGINEDVIKEHFREIIEKGLKDKLPLLYEIKLAETPNNSVTYSGD